MKTPVLRLGFYSTLAAGILAGLPFPTTITGDDSLRRRPMRRVIDPLAAMGARIEAADGRAPVHFLGTGGGLGEDRPLQAIRWDSPVASAQ